MIKFYFAGAIRGGREKLDIYEKINNLLRNYGSILDEHVANRNVNELEKDYTQEQIYSRDISWIKECDIVVAETSVPSLGVGYELAYAENLGKKIICIYDENTNLSAMIKGNKYFELIEYNNSSDLLLKLKEILYSLKK